MELQAGPVKRRSSNTAIVKHRIGDNLISDEKLPLHSLWERQPGPGVNECNRLFTTTENLRRVSELTASRPISLDSSHSVGPDVPSAD
jgi:hypothetical protein